MTVADISKRAKEIRAKSPSKLWTDCIKQASKELKAGKRTTGKVGATKSVRAKQSRSRPIGGNHKDTKSHNVRINVLSGMQGAEIPVTLNGLKTLTKGGFYVYMDKVDTLFKYIGKDTKNSKFPLIFDIHKKRSSGGYYFGGRYEYSDSLLKYLTKVKKPTAKELSIGHLKLLK